MIAMFEEPTYEHLEHTSDAYIAAYGRTLAQAFETAAVAMFDVMTEVDKVGVELEDYVEVKAEDQYGLLYNWLEALLVKSELNGTLYSKFTILNMAKTLQSYALKAKIWGEEFRPQKHPQKVGVKAVTYHRMEIIEEPNRVTLKFILDL